MEYSNVSSISRIVIIGETELAPIEILSKDFVSIVPLLPPLEFSTNQEDISFSDNNLRAKLDMLGVKK